MKDSCTLHLFMCVISWVCMCTCACMCVCRLLSGCMPNFQKKKRKGCNRNPFSLFQMGFQSWIQKGSHKSWVWFHNWNLSSQIWRALVTNNRFKIQWLILKILRKYLYFWNEWQLLDIEPMVQRAFHAHWWVRHDDYVS